MTAAAAPRAKLSLKAFSGARPSTRLWQTFVWKASRRLLGRGSSLKTLSRAN
jgi:hypothetical protein